MRPKMEQRITRNRYDEPAVVWDITDRTGKVEPCYSNYNDAYSRFVWLMEEYDEIHDGEYEQREAYLKRLRADISDDEVAEYGDF